MKNKFFLNIGYVALVVLLISSSTASSKQSRNNTSTSLDQIKQMMIQQSIRSYPGNCPCPYNRASNGSRCGKRSAYSKPGGYSPFCYPSDISDHKIRQFINKK